MNIENIKENWIIFVSVGFNLLLCIIVVANCIKMKSISGKYKKFMRELGNGNDINDALMNYVNKSEKIEDMNKQIIFYCEDLDKKLEKCIKKIGIVRYNAFKDTGSDLSFALALLNEYNDGILLNGIYSREMSNIYAKQINNGRSSTKISDEEKEALEKAINDSV